MIRLIFLLLPFLLLGCENNANNKSSGANDAATESAASSDAVTELVIDDVKVGDGAEAKAGQNVSVHYTGWLYDTNAPENRGKKFDSSVDRGEPFAFDLGAGRVIKGWDEGVAGMKVGGKRILTIPSEMGYGASGAGGVIPPNATLVFEVELLEVN